MTLLEIWRTERESRLNVLCNPQVRSWERIAHDAVTHYLLKQEATDGPKK